MSTGWKERPEHPRLTPRIVRWLRLRISAVIDAYEPAKNVAMTPGEAAALVDLYMETPARFAEWVPYSEITQSTRHLGVWRLNVAAFGAAWAGHLATAKRRAAAAKFGSLAEWLRDDLQRSHVLRGSLGTRDGGTVALSTERRKAMLHAALERQKRWPRLCQTCDEQFRPTRSRGVTCAACLAKAKRDRAMNRGPS
jgi:hypothetical protein